MLTILPPRLELNRRCGSWLCLTCYLSCLKHSSPSEILKCYADISTCSTNIQSFPRLLKPSRCEQRQQFIPASALCIIIDFLSAGRYLFPLWPRGKDSTSLHLFLHVSRLISQRGPLQCSKLHYSPCRKTVESRLFSPLSLRLLLPKGNLIILFHGKCKIT